MWRLAQLSKTWRCRPSQLLALENTYEAYCLDEAVAEFASLVEAELDRVDESKKGAEARKENILRRHLGLAPKFKDPATR